MTAEFLRDAAATAAVFGFFASAWFGWAQAILVTLVAVVAVPLARSRSVAVSAVTGLGAGTVLLTAALCSMASVLLWP
jgi:hypothetical protein